MLVIADAHMHASYIKQLIPSLLWQLVEYFLLLENLVCREEGLGLDSDGLI